MSNNIQKQGSDNPLQNQSDNSDQLDHLKPKLLPDYHWFLLSPGGTNYLGNIYSDNDFHASQKDDEIPLENYNYTKLKYYFWLCVKLGTEMDFNKRIEKKQRVNYQQQSDIDEMKEEMDRKNVWMWDFMFKIGILTVIWSETERFEAFWKGGNVQKYLFRNGKAEMEQIWGPYESLEGYRAIDEHQKQLQEFQNTAQFYFLFIFSWIPTLHYQVFSQTCSRFAKNVLKWWFKKPSSAPSCNMKYLVPVKTTFETLLEALYNPFIRKNWQPNGPFDIQMDDDDQNLIFVHRSTKEKFKVNISYYFHKEIPIIVEKMTFFTKENVQNVEILEKIYVLNKSSVEIHWQQKQNQENSEILREIQALINVVKQQI